MKRVKRARVCYPCRVCMQECRTNDNCICCDGCQCWLHAHCIQMNEETLEKFGDQQLTFFCAQCSLDIHNRYVDIFISFYQIYIIGISEMVFMGQMTQPTVSKHCSSSGPKQCCTSRHKIVSCLLSPNTFLYTMGHKEGANLFFF